MRYGPKKLVLTTHAVGGSYYRTGLAHDAAAFQKKNHSLPNGITADDTEKRKKKQQQDV